jgi:kynureninase
MADRAMKAHASKASTRPARHSPATPPPEQDGGKPNAAPAFQADEAFARHLDEIDPLQYYRAHFAIPRRKDGRDVIYLCGNSLGLMPRKARSLVEQELKDWAELAVDAHFESADGKLPWYSYHEQFREPGARLVGARPHEVVMMNSLTVNLHLMLVSFYRPSPGAARRKILIEDPCFPSDIYAVQSHIAARGLDPGSDLITARPRAGEDCLRTEDLEALLAARGGEIALILLGGVNFLTGQVMGIERVTAAGQRAGCTVGWDLAHAAGNVELHLHDWDVDFACWCSYKYLNAGPGAVAGCFVHERHGQDSSLPRFGGWWGNDPDTRFRMQLIPDFQPRAGADGWQVSNPPILSMAPLRASLELFDEAGMPALREKSIRLTGYLRWLLEQAPGRHRPYTIITPAEVESQGCQLSLVVGDKPRELFDHLQEQGVVGDFREPNVIRLAPVPLYNTFLDVWRAAKVLAAAAD